MVNFLTWRSNSEWKSILTPKAKSLIFSVWAAILVLISQPKELSSQTQQYQTSKNNDENKKLVWLSITAKKIIDWLPEEYQEEAYKLVWSSKFNFTPAWTINSRIDLDKIASDLSQAPAKNFSEITGFEKYSRDNVAKIIATIFNPADSTIWLKKWFEKKKPTQDEIDKYNRWITDAWESYLEKIKIWWKWEKEIWEKKLEWKVFNDFEILFNYWISRIPQQIQTREIYRRLFVASASLAEYKNTLSKNDNNLPIIATQVSEYISLIFPEQNSEKLYVKDWATYRLPSDQDIDILSEKIPLISSFLWIWTKALAVLIKKNSSNILEDLQRLPTPPTSWLWWWKKSWNSSAWNILWNTLPENWKTQTWSAIDDLIKSIWNWWKDQNWNWQQSLANTQKWVTWAWLWAEAISILSKLAENKKEEEDKIREAQRKINELDAQSQKLVAERNELLWKISDEENAISRELYDFWNQCSVITPASESLKRDLRSNPKNIENIPEWISRIDAANANIANTSSSIKWHYKAIVWYENRIDEINKTIKANNSEIEAQEKIIEKSKKAINEIDSSSQKIK